jgi:hypothetical protein
LIVAMKHSDGAFAPQYAGADEDRAGHPKFVRDNVASPASPPGTTENDGGRKERID